MPITSENSQTLGNWWSLTESVQESIKQTVPDKDTWTLHLTKQATGDWVFSLPQFLTFNEALTNGTEKSLDIHYINLTGNVPIGGEKMTLTVSSKEIKDPTTTLLHWQSDPMWIDANIYVDTVTDVDCWLCPYLQVLFKHVPDKLWFDITASA